MTARINGQALERELGRLSDGSDLRPTAVAERRTVARSRASSGLANAEAELIRLACADAKSLARRWRVVFGGRAPDLPRALLQRILAYRIQADAAGDLDPTTIKLLDRLGRGEIAEIALPELRAVKPGTLLVREWEGTLQRVVVLESGFAWNGRTYESLSKVARAITGTNWNGPRFFGLRDSSRSSTRSTANARHPRPTLKARPMKAGAACRPATTMAASRADRWSDRRCSGCSARSGPAAST